MVKNQGIFEEGESPYGVETTRCGRKGVFNYHCLRLYRVVSFGQLYAVIYWIAIGFERAGFEIPVANEFEKPYGRHLRKIIRILTLLREILGMSGKRILVSILMGR